MMGGIMDQLGGKLIAIVGLVLVVAFMGITTKLTKTVNLPQELMYMRMAISQTYASSPNGYADVSNQALLNADMVPQSIRRGDAIKNGFGGDITIAPGADSTSFTFTITGVPKSECVRLASSDPASWLSVNVNGTDIADGNVSTVIGSCTENSTIVFEAQ